MTLVKEGIPDYLAIAVAVTQKSDWREALDSMMAVVRSVFMFDNLALFLLEDGSSNLTEIVYARAVGRGQSAGAEASWGVEVANQAMARNEMIVDEPAPSAQGKADAAKDGDRRHNRLASPYLLSLPLRTAENVIGAVVFVRFGGPAYTPEQIQRVQYI